MPLHDTVHVDLRILQGCSRCLRVAAEHTSATTLATVERVIRARLAVYGCLIAAGWMPPTHLVLEQRADRRILRDARDVDGMASSTNRTWKGGTR